MCSLVEVSSHIVFWLSIPVPLTLRVGLQLPAGGFGVLNNPVQCNHFEQKLGVCALARRSEAKHTNLASSLIKFVRRFESLVGAAYDCLLHPLVTEGNGLGSFRLTHW